jgi:hypothetical protein
MTKYALLLATLALGGLAAPAWAQPTVNNGDFETGADMFNTFPGYLGFYTPPASTGFPPGSNPDNIPGWDSHTGFGVGVVPGSQPGNPNGTFRDNGDNDTNVAFLQGTASITQTIFDFTIGTTYQLDFDYNARVCCNDVPTLTVSMMSLGSGRTWSYNDSNIPPVDGGGVHVTPWYHGRFTFRADSDAFVLVVASHTVNGGDGTAVIDNLVLTEASP